MHGLDWDSSSGEDGTHQISKPNSQCQSTLGCRAFPPPPPPPDRSVPTTPGCEPAAKAFSRLQHLTQTATWLGSAQLIVLCGSALTTPSLAVGRMTVFGLMLGRVQLSSPTSRHDTLLAHLYPDQESVTRSQPSPHRSSAPALRPDERNWRQTDELQHLSWNPGPAEGSLIVRHGSFNTIPAAIGLKSTDQTWHLEQWLHLKFAGRKRRRDASTPDSKSQRQG